MISASDRENAVLLINEAIKSGASCKKACERLGITERTFYRWKKRKADTDSYEDGRPHADHSNPANKTTSFTTENTVIITKNGMIDINEFNTIGGTCPGNLIVKLELIKR